MASAPQLPKANVQPPYPMVSSPADAIENHGASGDDDIQHCLHPRTEEEGTGKISKRTRWTVLPLEGGGSTKDVYDKLWKAFGKPGKRWLSVAKHNGILRALLYKGDDGEVDLSGLPVLTPLCGPPADVSAGGRASRAATASFLQAWRQNEK